jgi:ArsR family transcriptional regulator
VDHVDTRAVYDLHERMCKAIADPKRLIILESLRHGARSVGELAEVLGTSQPNTSQHLAILRERSIVTAERRGTVIYYSLTSPKVLEALDILRDFMVAHPTAEDGELAG